MAKIGECALQAVIAPSRVFAGHAQKESDGLFGARRAPEFPAPPLVIGKDAFLAELLFQYPVPGAQVLEDCLLMPVDPAGGMLTRRVV